MNLTNRTIFIVSGDPVVGQRCCDELAAFGSRYRTTIVGTVDQARDKIGRRTPGAISWTNPQLKSYAAGKP